jgi:hypothetical protein
MELSLLLAMSRYKIVNRNLEDEAWPHPVVRQAVEGGLTGTQIAEDKYFDLTFSYVMCKAAN